MIKGLILIIRIYQGILVAFALSTWIDGLITFPDWYWAIMVLLAYPVILLFGWINIGPIGLGFVVALVLLDFLVKWLRKYDPDYQAEQEELSRQQAEAERDEASRMASEHQPPGY